MASSAPVAWTIAGSDSGGGAGLQVDLKVMAAFGVHGCSVVTALTAQNTAGVQRVEAVSERMVQAQLDSLAADLPPAAVKIGMLASACGTVARHLAVGRVPTVCDPVLRSTSGTALMEAADFGLFRSALLPQVDILTPNLPEAGLLVGAPCADAETAAGKLLETGARAVLVKGGHADGQTCRDYWNDGTEAFRIESPRRATTATHGTGCILSAALAAALACGESPAEAVVTAKTYLNQCLAAPVRAGAGPGPLLIRPPRRAAHHRPHVF